MFLALFLPAPGVALSPFTVAEVAQLQLSAFSLQLSIHPVLVKPSASAQQTES
jgi:hypothetical protein